MASFRIHEDQENASLGLRKENADLFLASQRRALGDLSQFACNQNRNTKLGILPNIPGKGQDENRTVRQINNEKNIVPPVAQFRAFNVYEDNPTIDAEVKKREPTFKPFVASKDIKTENFFKNAADNVRNLCLQDQLEKQPCRPKEPSQPRLPLQEKKLPLQEKKNQLQEKNPPLQEKKLPLQEKKLIEREAPVESPMSVVNDSSVLSMSISKNESQILEDVDDEADTTVAQTDREMFFHVAEYRHDIYKYMKEIEVKHRANPRYMRKQPDITNSMRAILVDWLAEVCEEYSQQSETLHLAVSYVDRFLSYMSVLRAKLQLVGTAATFIAAKYEEVYPPDIGEFVYITDDTYTKREVLRMEHLILKVLSFDLSTPTSLAFLSHLCISNGLSKKTFYLAAYIAELSLLEADPYLTYRVSIIAAASLATARHCLLCKDCSSPEQCLALAWPNGLVLATGYDLAALTPCLTELARTHAHAPLQPHRAIPDKYKNNKYEGVANISAKPMFPVATYQAPAPTKTDKPTSETARNT